MYKRMFGCGNRNRIHVARSITRSDLNVHTVNVPGHGYEVPGQVTT